VQTEANLKSINKNETEIQAPAVVVGEEAVTAVVLGEVAAKAAMVTACGES
jgi:hypothetical protein